MIVPMQRITVLCLAQDRESTLNRLRELGVLHVTHVLPPEGREVEQARHRLEEIQHALELLLPGNTAPSGETPEHIVKTVRRLSRSCKELKEERELLQSEVDRLAPFGNFDPALVDTLAAQGVQVSLYALPAEDPLPALPEAVTVLELEGDKRTRRIAVLSREEQALGLDPIRTGDRRLSDLQQRIAEIDQIMADHRKQVEQFSGDRPQVLALVAQAEDLLQFEETRVGMGDRDFLRYLRGFCPVESVDALRQAAQQHGWALLVEEPSDEERTPTLIRNPRWVHPIKAIFDFIGVLPGYREVDISALFLLFFSVFFAMIVGDAGYGAIYLGLTLWGMKKFPKMPRYVSTLMIIMSVCTIIWGILTGNYFGLSGLPPVLEGLKIPWLTGPNSDNNLMLLCFLIGAIHLTIAHGWRTMRLAPSLTALADLGWICTTWVMFFTARFMVLSRPFPPIMLAVLVIGILLIALFMTPFRKLKAEWFNHVMLPLNLVSNFVDVVSYVRLYAVGMATFAVASAFNQMGADAAGGLIGSLVAALIIFAGHGLNLMLATMGVLVHGVRLNTLEFSGHLGLEWTGTPYTPFKQRNETTNP